MQNDTGREFEIDKGPVYESHLKSFLEENPDKTEKDCPPAIVKMEGGSIFWPAKYFATVKYRGPILKLEETELYGVKTYKAKVRIFRNPEGDDDSLFLNLYIPETILNGYTPQAGDDIAGIMWIIGYLKF